jgi:hypothetical protein
LSFVEFDFGIILAVFFFGGEMPDAKDSPKFAKILDKILVQLLPFFGAFAGAVNFIILNFISSSRVGNIKKVVVAFGSIYLASLGVVGRVIFTE